MGSHETGLYAVAHRRIATPAGTRFCPLPDRAGDRRRILAERRVSEQAASVSVPGGLSDRALCSGSVGVSGGTTRFGPSRPGIGAARVSSRRTRPWTGVFGGETTRTRQAIRTWQATKGLAETGYLTREQAETLMALGQEAQEAERAAQAQAEQAAQGRSGGTRTIAEGSRIRWGKSRRMS